jgi:hypothetical protein
MSSNTQFCERTYEFAGLRIVKATVLDQRDEPTVSPRSKLAVLDPPDVPFFIVHMSERPIFSHSHARIVAVCEFDPRNFESLAEIGQSSLIWRPIPSFEIGNCLCRDLAGVGQFSL